MPDWPDCEEPAAGRWLEEVELPEVLPAPEPLPDEPEDWPYTATGSKSAAVARTVVKRRVFMSYLDVTGTKLPGCLMEG